MAGLNADSILSSLTQDVQKLGQGGAQALLTKVNNVINAKTDAAQAALTPSDGAAASSTATKAAQASGVTPKLGVVLGAGLVLAGFVAWKVFQSIKGG